MGAGEQAAPGGRRGNEAVVSATTAAGVDAGDKVEVAVEEDSGSDYSGPWAAAAFRLRQSVLLKVTVPSFSLGKHVIEAWVWVAPGVGSPPVLPWDVSGLVLSPLWPQESAVRGRAANLGDGVVAHRPPVNPRFTGPRRIFSMGLGRRRGGINFGSKY